MGTATKVIDTKSRQMGMKKLEQPDFGEQQIKRWVKEGGPAYHVHATPAPTRPLLFLLVARRVCVLCYVRRIRAHKISFLSCDIVHPGSGSA